jgi:hypothetical protein
MGLAATWVLLIAAAIGWVYLFLIWMGVVGKHQRYVANRYAVCPYCPHNIKPGDRIHPGRLGMGHLNCVHWLG